jgi:hypothetical protein
MSSFMVNTCVMAKFVTAVLQNTDEFAAIETLRGQLVDDPLTDPQKEAGTKIGRKLFLMNRRALRARYGDGDFLALPKFVFEKWCDATPVEQFAAMRCLLYQCCEGRVPNDRLYRELNHVAGELAQRIVQDLLEYEKAPWGS